MCCTGGSTDCGAAGARASQPQCFLQGFQHANHLRLSIHHPHLFWLADPADRRMLTRAAAVCAGAGAEPSHMSRKATMNVATLCSVALFAVCIAAILWIACLTDQAHNGVLIGNNQLCGSWDGGELRIGLFKPEPPLYLRFPGEAERWSLLPPFNLSLWLPLSLSLVLPTVWAIRHRRATRVRGFPIEVPQVR